MNSSVLVQSHQMEHHFKVLPFGLYLHLCDLFADSIGNAKLDDNSNRED